MAYADLIQGNISKFLPYKMNKPLDIVQKEMGLENIYRMHALECPYGASRKVHEVLKEYMRKMTTRTEYPNINLYPDSNCYKLKHKLYEVYHYNTNQIVVDADVQALNTLICNAFLSKDMTVCMPNYSSFEMENLIKMRGIRLVLSNISEDWSPNFNDLADNVLATNARLVYIANPSIPFGGFAVKARISNFLSRLNPQQTIVVINEEFYEYLGNGYSDLYPLIKEFPNLILLRSFSHAFGLTDLRIGYALASDEIASCLNLMKIPYGVSQLAQDCACAALSDLAFVQDVVNSTTTERNRMWEFFTFFDLPIINTITNSITIPFGDQMDRFYHDLQMHGFFVRDLSYWVPYKLCNITLGRAAQTDIMLSCLEKAILHHQANDYANTSLSQNRQKADNNTNITIAHAQNEGQRVVVLNKKDKSKQPNFEDEHPIDFNAFANANLSKK